MKKLVAEHVPGYSYGSSELQPSPVSLEELELLKISVGFTDEDHRTYRWREKCFAIRPVQWFFIGVAK